MDVKEMGSAFVRQYNKNPAKALLGQLCKVHIKHIIVLCFSVPLETLSQACSPICMWFFQSRLTVSEFFVCPDSIDT